MNSIFILNSAVLAVLIVFVCGLAIYFFKFKKRMDLFFRGGEKDLEKLLASQLTKLENQGEKTKRMSKDISRLEKISQKSFQKIGLIRFNPLRNVGGDQSFSVALLNLNNDGFVITSIYSREGNRIYAKPVSRGKSEYSLSKEENEAIEKAKG